MTATMSATFRFLRIRLAELIAASEHKTAKAFADHHGFDQGQLSRWLNGKATPSLENAAWLARVFNLPLDSLIQFDESED